jgi:hypothetical protein
MKQQSCVAEGVRFELTVELPLQRFSRPSPSTARPPLPLKKYKADRRQQTGKRKKKEHAKNLMNIIPKTLFDFLERIHVN